MMTRKPTPGEALDVLGERRLFGLSGIARSGAPPGLCKSCATNAPSDDSGYCRERACLLAYWAGREDGRKAKAAVASTVAVSRAVLAEALEQIEATHIHHDYENPTVCAACDTIQRKLDGSEHAPDCRYVRVRDYLKGLGL